VCEPKTFPPAKRPPNYLDPVLSPFFPADSSKKQSLHLPHNKPTTFSQTNFGPLQGYIRTFFSLWALVVGGGRVEQSIARSETLFSPKPGLCSSLPTLWLSPQPCCGFRKTPSLCSSGGLSVWRAPSLFCLCRWTFFLLLPTNRPFLLIWNIECLPIVLPSSKRSPYQFIRGPPPLPIQAHDATDFFPPGCYLTSLTRSGPPPSPRGLPSPPLLSQSTLPPFAQGFHGAVFLVFSGVPPLRYLLHHGVLCPSVVWIFSFLLCFPSMVKAVQHFGISQRKAPSILGGVLFSCPWLNRRGGAPSPGKLALLRWSSLVGHGRVHFSGSILSPWKTFARGPFTVRAFLLPDDCFFHQRAPPLRGPPRDSTFSFGADSPCFFWPLLAELISIFFRALKRWPVEVFSSSLMELLSYKMVPIEEFLSML